MMSFFLQRFRKVGISHADWKGRPLYQMGLYCVKYNSKENTICPRQIRMLIHTGGENIPSRGKPAVQSPQALGQNKRLQAPWAEELFRLSLPDNIWKRSSQKFDFYYLTYSWVSSLLFQYSQNLIGSYLVLGDFLVSSQDLSQKQFEPNLTATMKL